MISHRETCAAQRQAAIAAAWHSAVAGYPDACLWLAWAVIPHLLHLELPSYLLTFQAVPCLAHTSCTGGQTFLGPLPPLTLLHSGGISRKLWEGDIGKRLPSLAGFPKKQQQASLNSYLPLTKQGAIQLSTEHP